MVMAKRAQMTHMSADCPLPRVNRDQQEGGIRTHAHPGGPVTLTDAVCEMVFTDLDEFCTGPSRHSYFRTLFFDSGSFWILKFWHSM